MAVLQRDTLKRMCFKTLPPVMVVHLKRFDYDWEANRAIKFDDYFEVSRPRPKTTPPTTQKNHERLRPI